MVDENQEGVDDTKEAGKKKIRPQGPNGNAGIRRERFLDWVWAWAWWGAAKRIKLWAVAGRSDGLLSRPSRALAVRRGVQLGYLFGVLPRVQVPGIHLLGVPMAANGCSTDKVSPHPGASSIRHQEAPQKAPQWPMAGTAAPRFRARKLSWKPKCQQPKLVVVVVTDNDLPRSFSPGLVWNLRV